MVQGGDPLQGRRALIGMGCMRLSTAEQRDDAHAVRVIHAALDAGVRLLDTADVYCHDQSDLGHNERLIAEALGSWDGPAAEVTVATKGGLTRPRGKWVADGSAAHLLAACDASRAALGTARLDLYLLHAPDPRTTLAASLRGLAALLEADKVAHVGLCNVTLGELKQAQEQVPISAVQVALSPLDLTAVRGGLVEYCRANGILLLAHSPLGGPRGMARLQRALALVSDPDPDPDPDPDSASAPELALAWLRSLAPVIVPLPGPTRPETARSAAAAQQRELSADVRDAIDGAFPAVRQLRVDVAQRRPPPDAAGEVVIIMGIPGAGKTSLARALTAQGYERLNRDERGGRLADIAAALDCALAGGSSRVVLDNTYPRRSARNEVVDAAWRHGRPVRCRWLTTPLEQAQINVTLRMWQLHGRLLEPQEMQRSRRGGAEGAVPPRALFDYRRLFEAPEAEEGFAAVESIAFVRRWGEEHTHRALLVALEAVGSLDREGAWQADPEGERVLRDYLERDWMVLATAWLPSLGDGRRQTGPLQVADRLRAEAAARGLPMEVAVCLHAPGPPVCWCRKPLPGLVVGYIHRHRLDPAACRYLGSAPADKTLATRLGIPYCSVDAPGRP